MRLPERLRRVALQPSHRARLHRGEGTVRAQLWYAGGHNVEKVSNSCKEGQLLQSRKVRLRLGQRSDAPGGPN